jgi:hypothetical protein
MSQDERDVKTQAERELGLRQAGLMKSNTPKPSLFRGTGSPGLQPCRWAEAKRTSAEQRVGTVVASERSPDV